MQQSDLSVTNGFSPERSIALVVELSNGHAHPAAQALRSAAHLGRLGPALAHACEQLGGVRTVSRLAHDVAIDRRRLCELWREQVPSAIGLRLEDFLGLLVLLRGNRIQLDRGRWIDASVDLGVHIRTLRDIARRCTGHSLREVSGAPLGSVILAISIPFSYLLAHRDNVITLECL